MRAEKIFEKTEQMMVSVIIPVHNGANTLRRCLEGVAASDYADFECIVVDDSSTDSTVEIAEGFSSTVVALSGGPFGPAYARNRGSEAARGDVVFFVDADVVIRPDTVSKVAATFSSDPEVDAMFGSYDDSPDAGDFSSQYRNLMHHFVHQQAREQAVTFWSGCGAVRREVFLEAGGFDQVRYTRPCVEDIELGYRLVKAGHKIVVNKEVQVKHLKRWTLKGMIKADIFDRAIPWTQLILSERDLPNDLNLGLSQRASALLLCALVTHLGMTAFFHNIIILPLIAMLFFFVVGYWSQGDGAPPLSRMTFKAEKITIVLTLVIAALSLYSGRPLMLVPISLLLLGMIAGRRWGRTSIIWRRILFTTFVAASVTAFAIIVVNFSVWLLTPIFGLIGTIVVLNLRFYLFFVRKRGLIFATAVIPFHFLYYLYSIVAFALVSGARMWNAGLRR